MIDTGQKVSFVQNYRTHSHLSSVRSLKKPAVSAGSNGGRGDDEQFQYNSSLQAAQHAEISFYQLFVVKTSIWVTYFLIIS